MTETLRRRPLGELLVEVTRPPMRFGHALHVAVRSHDGDVWLAQVEEGEMLWRRYRPDTMPTTPTMYLDDDVMAELYRVLSGLPVRRMDDPLNAHLQDTVGVRDRLLRLVEELTKRTEALR